MTMRNLTVRAVLETNGRGYLLYAENFPGAFVRGPSLEEAMAKWPRELASYLSWRDGPAAEKLSVTARIVQEKRSGLHVEDADSDVLFDRERGPMERTEYEALRELCLRSAGDFLALYQSVPEKDLPLAPPRESFYGPVPRTAAEMYKHTRDVNRYYFGEIGVEAGNEPDILRCREAGFALLERQMNFLANPVFDGSYDEQWSLRKVLRRFLWHDRIHAKALTRRAIGIWGRGAAADPFRFGVE